MLSPHATVAMQQTAKGNGAKVQQQLHLMLYNTTISREPLESPVQVVPPTMGLCHQNVEHCGTTSVQANEKSTEKNKEKSNLLYKYH